MDDGRFRIDLMTMAGCDVCGMISLEICVRTLDVSMKSPLGSDSLASLSIVEDALAESDADLRWLTRGGRTGDSVAVCRRPGDFGEPALLPSLAVA